MGNSQNGGSRWLSADTDDSRGPSIAELAGHFHLPNWIARILWLRAREWNSHSLENYSTFLSPSLKGLPSPFGLPDMDIAVDRIIAALDTQEKIVLYADYDVDGTVGAAVMRRFFRMVGYELEVYQPDRHKEGYGVNTPAIEKLAAQGVNLVITVDCGIRSVEPVERANELGVDVIIVDHHELGEIMPAAVAVLDHKRPDNESPIRSLCGAGMAFYLAIGMRARMRETNWFTDNGVAEPDLRALMDLVAVATVADMVPLIEENRILVSIGAGKLRKNPVVGLQALCTVANVPHQKIEASQFGFVIGPRINAAGRLASAGIALELLSTDDPEVALELAGELERLNRKRMKIQNDVFKAAMEQAEPQRDAAAIVVAGQDWHEGVIGIAAAKLLDRFQRPVVVFTINEESGEYKGSARSVDAYDLMPLFEASSEHITQFGGHAAAAGLSVPFDKIDMFREALCEAVVQASGAGADEIEFVREFQVDAEVASGDITFKALSLLGRLGPFGIANKEPVISINECVVHSSQLLKDKHLKLKLGNNLSAIWFNSPEDLEVDSGEAVDLLFTPQKNEFRGRVSIDLHLKDLRVRD